MNNPDKTLDALRAARDAAWDEQRRRFDLYPILLAACESVAGVFQDSSDPPLYARKCILAIKAAKRKE